MPKRILRSVTQAVAIAPLILMIGGCGGDGSAGAPTGSTPPQAPAPAPTPAPTPSPTPVAVAPALVGQLSDVTAAVGYPVTLSVTATGTDLSYRWLRNGSVVADAVTSQLVLNMPTLADDQATFSVQVTNSLGSVSSRTARLGVLQLVPQLTSYTSFNGATVQLYAWEGRQTALLTASMDLSPPAVAKIVGALDGAYASYRAATGYTPSTAKAYNGKLTVSEVPATCGAACGYLGATGIELLTSTFASLYTGVRDRSEYDQAVFYEFGRNFWSLGRKLTYRSPDSDVVVTGFAVYMRFFAIDAMGLRGGPFGSWSFPEFQTRVEAMIDLYEADATQTFQNTLQVGRPQANNPSALGATDLFASICFRLARDNGGPAFIARLWAEASKRPDAAVTQDAVDNFVIAASIAANRNLVPLFVDRWRWPVSEAARREIVARV